MRSALPSEQVFPQIRRVLASADSNLPPENLRTLNDQIKLNIRTDRLVLNLAAAFAILATSLAMLGLYGVMANSVARRTREIGIRMALGAEPGRIRSMVLKEVLWILGTGLIVGVPAAAGLARLVQSQLFGVKASDAWVMIGAAGALIFTAIAAGQPVAGTFGISLDVDPSELISGTNTLELATTNVPTSYPPVVYSIDLAVSR